VFRLTNARSVRTRKTGKEKDEKNVPLCFYGRRETDEKDDQNRWILLPA